MSNISKNTILEPSKDVPVAYDVDVVVAGAGTSGLFSAIASGRSGASTLLVDRFGWIGGSNGPGMVINGGAFNAPDTSISGGLSDLVQEYKDRVESLLTKTPSYTEYSNITAHVGMEMLEEAGVKLLLSVYIGDPILENDQIKGFFVEGVSGRAAVLAKVVIDSTGDAILASRAGAPMIREVPVDPANDILMFNHARDPEFGDCFNSTGTHCVILGADLEKYKAFEKKMVESRQAGNDTQYNEWLESMGEFTVSYKIPKYETFDDDNNKKVFYYRRPFEIRDKLKMFYRIQSMSKVSVIVDVNIHGEYDSHSMDDITFLETEIRKQIFDYSMFLRKYIPGFENCYLAFIAPFLGGRGGPCIEGEKVLSVKDTFDGTKFDDALFCNVHEAQNHAKKAEPSGFDVPFRMCLPKGLKGLLVSGRGASYLRRGHDPTGMRNRCSMMVLGHALGVAAAMAVDENESLRSIDIKRLQKKLQDEGIAQREQ